MEQTGSLAAALANAHGLLSEQPALARRHAEAILEASPNHPEALFILGAALRRQADLEAAREVLQPLSAAQPRAAIVHFEWAAVQAELGQVQGATASLGYALGIKPNLPGGWRLMGDLLFSSGDLAGADAAYARHVQGAASDPGLMRAARALVEADLAGAEQHLRRHLEACPHDVAALRLLAEVRTRLGQDAEAEALLALCLERAPSFTLARHNYAVVLFRQNQAQAAIGQLDILIAEDGRNPNYRSLLAACLAMVAEYDRAIEIYRPLLAEYPQQPKVWMSYGHALKTVGHRDEAIDAYRSAIAQDPGLGEAYWSLANMKTAILAPAEVQALRDQLDRPDLAVEDRFHLHYTLGHVLEQARDYTGSWRHYAAGATLRRGEIDYEAVQTTQRCQRMRALMTADFFADRRGVGCHDQAPIFIVGLPRSGSTLIEQILASHSTIEGTMELPEIAGIARDLGRVSSGGDAYPEALAGLSPADFTALGARFLERTQIYRKTGKPVLIDKMPNNFIHTGLIHLILPRARIIDARRHPMAACFSAFKQHFARGQHFSYSLRELGLYYRDYAVLMAHFDAVLPGRVLRVQYEDMVEDLALQTRRLLTYCGAPFEEACLRFHENPRAVRTASAEQVRRPIFREGLEQWRNYEAWLGPLAEALEL